MFIYPQLGWVAPNVQVIGTCNLCHGRVLLPAIFHSAVPPVGRCEGCGATVMQPSLPVLPMQPAPVRAGWSAKASAASAVVGTKRTDGE